MRTFENNPVPVVALYSPYPQAGKSTVADMLVEEFGFRRVKFAGAIKSMLRALLLYQGAKFEQIDEMIEGSKKECVSDLLGFRSPRYAMQTLGTEWGREAMDADFWTDIARGKISSLVSIGKPVVIDDMRFENEAHMLRDFGGATFVKITRPSVEPKKGFFKGLFGGHKSEGGLESFAFDLEIVNDFPSRETFYCEAIYDLVAHMRSKNFFPVMKVPDAKG